MPTYEVTVYGTWVKTSHVRASDIDEARAIWDRCDGEDARVELVDEKDLGEDDTAWTEIKEDPAS
jgi:hypothetical protein